MRTLTLKRISLDREGTYGVLMDGTKPFAVTLERPWADNQRSISCIPAGEYLCSRKVSPRFGKTFEVTNVPGRSHILFHKGNTADDTEGCILVAEEFGTLGNNKVAVLRSGAGFGEFMNKLAGTDEFTLIVQEV